MVFKGASSSTPKVEASEVCIWHQRTHGSATVFQELMLQLRAGGDLVQGPVSKSHSVLSLAGLMSESTNGLELHPLVTSLAEQIRTCRTALPDLSPLAVDPALEAISGMLDGETLFIRNELHQCLGLRKLHLEIARLGMGLQILHCVFFPDPRFDLPVFGADIVASKAGISAAIVDLSPVCDALPDAVSQPLSALKLPPFQQVRDLPAWGTIFSPYVKFIRPVDEQEETWFVGLVAEYLNILRQAILATAPDAVNELPTINRQQGQLSYCRQQKRNDKTRRVLEKAFGSAWADRYIEEMLFDDPPPLP